MNESSSPLWRWVALGWLVTAAALAWSFRSYPEPAELEAEVERHRPVWELEQLSPRELRSLPSVGPARAADVVEARWSRPPEEPLVLEEVPGIGPATSEVVHRSLEDRRGPFRATLKPRRFGGLARPGPNVPPPGLPRLNPPGPSGAHLGTLGSHGTLPTQYHGRRLE
ncbi:MAG: hypothetical protein P1V81_09025 [Planctomycetota bacterium]|nr:hypothetical protein [Planctomycetota bacterium]